MKKKRNLYIIAFLCFITLVGVTIAYLGSTSVLENIFEAGTYKTITHEEFTSPTNWTPGDTTLKTITTKNEGTIPVRVRVKLEESWTSKNNDDLPLTYYGENVAIINLANELDWILKDEYYYYLSELAPGETTPSLIESVTFNPHISADVNCTTVSGTVTCESTGDGYDGATYRINITTETIQAKNYETIWENFPKKYDYVGDNPCTYNGDLEVGTEYVNGQYTYVYRMSPYDNEGLFWKKSSDVGWGVSLTDHYSSDPITTTLCSSINNIPIISTAVLFSDNQATSVDLSSFDTSNVTDMSYMFSWSNAQELDLSNFDTSKVADMNHMFYGSQTTSIDVSSFDTSNVTDMSYMFGATKDTSLILSNLDTSKVTDMNGMFSSCYSTSLDLSNFNTSNVTDMHSMFANSRATTINLSSFDTSNVITMNSMFDRSVATSLDLSSFDTSNVTDMRYMFNNALATIGYARTQADADRFNASSNKPSTLTFVLKNN